MMKCMFSCLPLYFFEAKYLDIGWLLLSLSTGEITL